MSEPTVLLEDVCKTYPSGNDELKVIRDVNLQALPGESIAITGASGCGKSTLLNLIGGLDLVDSGRIEACGYTVSGMTEKELTAYRSCGVGFVFQFHYLLKDFTARENIMLPLVMQGMRRRKAASMADEALERVRVEGRASHYPAQLSGGERQRVALARALINNPPLILADEPTGNLDEAHKEVVANLLFSLTAEAGKTLILVTHAPDLAGRADKALALREGRLVPS